MNKTLHITNSYHPTSGGIRTFYQALLQAANTHQRLMRLVVPGKETSVEEVGAYGRIYTIEAPRAPVFDQRYRLLLPQQYAWPGETVLRKVLSEERPDLIEICDKFFLAYLPGVLRRRWIPEVPVPAIVGLTCERLDDMMAFHVSDSNWARGLCRFYMKKLYAPRFDFHIAISDYTAAEIRRALSPAAQDRLYVEAMGADYERFSRTKRSPEARAALLDRMCAKKETVLLLYAGRLGHEKNLLLLPPTLQKLVSQGDKDFRLILAGDGPMAPELRTALEACAPGRAAFWGQCGAGELAELYAAADVFLHPNAHEPFGIAPLEAMAAGLPLVAPASGGLLTYANRQNAWLVEASPDGFASAIWDVTTDEKTRQEKTARAVKAAEKFAWGRVTERYFQLYDRLLARFRGQSLNRPAEFKTEEDALPAGTSGYAAA